MRIACVLAAAELDGHPADLILFPEGVDATDLEAAASMQPEAVVVGAIRDGINSRAVVRHKNQNHVEYLKVDTDGRTQGIGDAGQNPIAHFPTFSVAALVCMDVQNPGFSLKVLDTLRASTRPVRILCIPADMGSYWFEGDTLHFPERYAGMYVALCNSTETHNVRCKSFIADKSGNKIRVQSNTEPIYADVP